MPGQHSSTKNLKVHPSKSEVNSALFLELACFFGVSISLLSCFLAPEITANDAGELAAAARELGIAHPPGFPIFLLYENILMQMLGLGELGFRANVGSAICASLCLCIVLAMVRTRGAPAAISWLVCIATLFAPIFTVHAVTVEVYAGAALFIIVAVECLLRYLETNDLRYAYALAIVLGLGGLAHHPIIRLVGVCFAPFVLYRSGLKVGIKLFGVSACVGLLASLYLPFRSSKHPNRDWGAPRSFDAFFDHLTGERIRTSYMEQIGRLDIEVWDQLLNQLFWSSGVLFALSMLGILWLRKWKIVQVLTVLLTMDLLYATFVNPMGVRDYQNGWLSTVLVCPILALMFSEFSKASQNRRFFAHMLLVLLVGYQSVRYLQKESFSQASPWYESMTRLHSVAAPDSLMLTASDSASSISTYLQVVEQSRPDIASVVRQHLFRASSTEPNFRRREKVLKGWTAGAQLPQLVNLTSEWPLIWEWADDRDANSRPKLEQSSYPFHGRGQTPIGSRVNHWMQGDPFGGWSQYSGFVRAQVLANSSFSSSQGEKGSSALEHALKWNPADQLLQHRYGALLTRQGDLLKAEKALMDALQVLTADEQLLEQLVRVYLGLKRFEAAIQLTETILPSKQYIAANLLGLKAVALANLERYEEAIEACQTALAINPEQIEAKVTLRIISNQNRR